MTQMWIPGLSFPEAGWLGAKIKGWLVALERANPPILSNPPRRKATPEELARLREKFAKLEGKS